MTPGTCKHYNGTFSNKCCARGVNYKLNFSDGEEFGYVLKLPCVEFRTLPANGRGTLVRPGQPTIRKEIDRRGFVAKPCPLREEPSTEEVEADRIEWQAVMDRSMLGLKAASAWRVRPKPEKDRAEVVECPACKGRLHLSQSAYNGHVHGKCETDNCVSWME